jgi:hypothetical protein
MGLVIWLIIVLILWVLYIEFAPRMGNIWLRPNSKGNKTFRPSGILNLMIQPFTDLQYWYPRNWDLNIYAILIITTIIYYLVTPWTYQE